MKDERIKVDSFLFNTRRIFLYAIEFIILVVTGVNLEVKIKVKTVGDLLIIYLDGEIDHHTTRIIREEIDDYLDRLNIAKIAFNFNSVTFMDSSGVGMILGRYRKINKIGGKVAVTNLNQKVKRIFEISGLFNFIEQYENEKEAIEKM